MVFKQFNLGQAGLKKHSNYSSLSFGQAALTLIFACPQSLLAHLKVMLHETICNDDFQHDAAWQHCCGIVSNGYNIVPTPQRCVALKIIIANHRPVLHHLQLKNLFHNNLPAPSPIGEERNFFFLLPEGLFSIPDRVQELKDFTLRVVKRISD